ncbi:MAG TPA: hypothetical protein VF945_09875 [Polyangia bacterium]
MRTSRWSTAATFVFFAAGGCFPAFPPDGAPAAGGGGSGGQSTGAGGSAGSGGGSGGGDMALAATAGDLGSAPGDLAGGGGGDLAVVCDKLASTAGLSDPTGHHNAGTECQGCHAPGGGAPTFYVGGTLYSAATGGTAVAGATINITDAAGKTVKAISANNGNFWTATALTYPIKVDASLCPTTTPMVASVGGNGACNNCHGSAMRVHTP